MEPSEPCVNEQDGIRAVGVKRDFKFPSFEMSSEQTLIGIFADEALTFMAVEFLERRVSKMFLSCHPLSPYHNNAFQGTESNEYRLSFAFSR